MACAALPTSCTRQSVAESAMNRARWHVSPRLRAAAASALPSVLLDASWQDAAQHCFGAPSRPICGCRPVRTYRCAFARSPPPLTQPCGQGASPRLASHCLQPQPRSRAALRSRRAHVRDCRRAAAARAQTMGFGAGDIKDKFRTYDGDADKRLRKKLEKSGKFDESFKTPVRISASRRVETPSRRRCDSWPSHDAVGGFLVEFERVSGEIATRPVTHRSA